MRLSPVQRTSHGRRRERGAAPRKPPPPPRDLARPPKNPRPKNPLARPRRRGEGPQQKSAGVRPQNPEEVHGGGAEETARAQLYRLCGIAFAMPPCRKISLPE